MGGKWRQLRHHSELGKSEIWLEWTFFKWLKRSIGIWILAKFFSWLSYSHFFFFSPKWQKKTKSKQPNMGPGAQLAPEERGSQRVPNFILFFPNFISGSQGSFFSSIISFHLHFMLYFSWFFMVLFWIHNSVPCISVILYVLFDFEIWTGCMSGNALSLPNCPPPQRA